MSTSVAAAERLLLWVYTNPARGARTRDSAYYKWHEAELRPALLDLDMPAAPALFLSCTCWVAADGQSPAYLSLYDLARRSAVYDPAYVALSEKHALETRAAAAAFVESRVYEPLDTPVPTPPHFWPGASSSSDESDDERPQTRYITVIEAELKRFAEGEFCRWYDEEHIPLLSLVPGWVRSRRYVLREKLGVDGGWDSDGYASGGETETETDADSEGGNVTKREEERRWRLERARERRRMREAGPDRPPKFLAIHEWSSLDAFETRQYRRATSTPWRMEVLKEGRVLRYEIRVFRAS